MRRIVVPAAGCLLLAGVLVVHSPATEPAAANPQQPDSITWQYSESADGYWRPPSGGEEGGPTGPATVFVDVGEPGGSVYCDRDDPDFACATEEGEDAGYLGVYCADTPGENGLPRYPQIRYEREIGPDGEPEQWLGVDEGSGCLEPDEDDFVPMEEISTDVEFELEQRVGQPDVVISPQDGRTLVNLPTIVSTNYPEGIDTDAAVELLSLQDPTRIRVDFHIDRPGGGLDGEIIADANFDWNFQEGGTAEGRGQPYDGQRTPQNSPGYYTAPVFETTGTKTMSLAVRWTGDVLVDTLDPEAMDPVEIDPVTEEIEVVESRSLLTR